MNFNEVARKIIDLVGGESNVSSVVYCMTRLRFSLKDSSKADLNALKKLDGVLGANVQGGQVQVVIGNDVRKVYQEMTKLYPKLSDSLTNGTTESVPGGKFSIRSLFDRFLSMLSAILVPSLPPVIGGGMLKGIYYLLTSDLLGQVLDPASGTAMVINIASDCMFFFFPFILAVSAAKRFKTNEYMAVAVAGSLMVPSIAAMAAEGIASISFLGLPVPMVNYSGSVIPIILSVFLLSYVYRFFEDRIPSIISAIFTPMLTLLIVIPLSLIALAPLGFYVGEGIAHFLNFLMETVPWLAGFVVGATRPFVVLLGLHHAIRPITMQQVSTYGFSTIGALNFFGTMSQAAAALGIALVSRNKKTKQIGYSGAISGFLGVTEPALYGIITRFKAAIVGAFLGGGLGGMVGAIFGARQYVAAMPSVLAFPTFLGDTTFGWVLGLLVTVVATVVITVALSKTVFRAELIKDDADDGSQDPTPVSSSNAGTVASGKTIRIVSPSNGKIVKLESVNDKTFAEKIVGEGIAIFPSDGKVYAPADGVVTSVFPTNHALGMVTDDGVEVLIHIGLDTVELNGKHFESHVKNDQKVKKGDLLVTFDKDGIVADGYDPTVIMVVSNTGSYLSVVPELDSGNVSVDQDVIAVIV